MPGTGIEVWWDVDDNAGLFKRRLPDPPSLMLTVRNLPALDGAALRETRECVKVPLTRVATASGLSLDYLSKVERGELGRPATSGVLAAYRQAGVVLPGVAVGVCPVPAPGGWWRTQHNERHWGRWAGAQ